MGSGFCGEFNQASPSGVSQPGLPADPGGALQRFSAVPHGTAGPCLRRCPALRLGVIARSGGHPGCRGLVGMGAPTARQGSGRGPAAGEGFEIFRGTQLWLALWRFSVGPFGRFLPRFPTLLCFASRPIPATPSAVSCVLARGDGAGGGGLGCLWGIRGVAGSRA